MIEFYLTGVLVALGVGLLKLVIGLTNIFSLRAANLSKIGVYYSFTSGNFTSEKRPSAIAFLFLALYVLLFAPLFSWLAVASFGFIWILHLITITRAAELPEEIKKAIYKIANYPLSKEEVRELFNATNAALGVKPNIEHEEHTLILEEGPWGEYLTLDTANMRYCIYSHAPDYHSSSDSILDYKIEGCSIQQRLIEEKHEHLGKITHFVRDNVVLVSEISQYYCHDPLKTEETSSVRKKAIDWSELQNWKIKYFIMSKHRDVFPEVEFKKLVRGDFERIKNGVSIFLRQATAAGFNICETDEGYSLQGESEEIAERNIDLLRDLKITCWEVFQYKKIVAELSSFLGETGSREIPGIVTTRETNTADI